MTQVFVTGGTGFVGRHLIARLIADGHSVVALSRTPQGDSALAALGAQPVRGDLDHVGAWSDAIAGCGALVHAASPITVWGEDARLKRQIVDATAAIRDACAAHGVGRLVYLSSESVLQSGPSLEGIDESFPYPAEPNSRYGKYKKAAEQLLLAKPPPPEVIILRPSFIWGDGGQISDVLDKVRSGGFVWVDDGRAPMEMSHVDNVVEAIVLALSRGTPGHVYFVTDGEDLDVRTVLGGLIEAFGVKLPEKSMPGWLARPAASVIEWIWKRLGLSSTPPLSRFQLDFVALPRRYSIARAEAELGYRPVVSFEQGLKQIREGRTPA